MIVLMAPRDMQKTEAYEAARRVVEPFLPDGEELAVFLVGEIYGSEKVVLSTTERGLPSLPGAGD